MLRLGNRPPNAQNTFPSLFNRDEVDTHIKWLASNVLDFSADAPAATVAEAKRAALRTARTYQLIEHIFVWTVTQITVILSIATALFWLITGYLFPLAMVGVVFCAAVFLSHVVSSALEVFFLHAVREHAKSVVFEDPELAGRFKWGLKTMDDLAEFALHKSNSPAVPRLGDV